MLGFSPSGLSFVLYKQSDAGKYKKFEIPKKSGGTRQISAPLGALKAIQRELATYLNDCRAEILAATPRKPLSHAFRKDLSIITNAHNHTSRRFVLNVDLEDFFPTINFGRVRGFFMKDADFALNEKVATVLAQIACFENELPQGSPCSPVISDMVGHLLDVRLVALAKSHRVTYSRYADDLTFSTNQKSFPHGLAFPGATKADPWVAGDGLKKAIERAGFKLNGSKTRMQFRGSLQMVTGLTVNMKVSVSQHYWRGIRSMCRSLYQTGTYHFPTPPAGTPQGTPPVKIASLDPIAGMLGHAYNVRLKSGHLPDDKHEDIVFGQTDLHRFWFYRTFVAAARPVLVCEGKTDNIYIRNAIQRLPAFHPRLGALTPNGFTYAVSLFSYTNTIHKVLKITGGIGPLLTLIYGYHAKLKAFKHRPLLQPVIILVDNDIAIGQKVCASLNKRFGIGISHDAPDPFFYLGANLYLVKTPLVAGLTMTCIEDLFDATTKAIPLDGKVFHAEKDGFDRTKHIPKVDFATKVVSANAGSISFVGFAPLLDRIVTVMDDYATKLAAPPSP